MDCQQVAALILPQQTDWTGPQNAAFEHNIKQGGVYLLVSDVIAAIDKVEREDSSFLLHQTIVGHFSARVVDNEAAGIGHFQPEGVKTEKTVFNKPKPGGVEDRAGLQTALP